MTTLHVHQVDIALTHAGGLHTDMVFYEFDDSSRKLKLVTIKNVQLPGYAFVHDFAITENHIVVMLNPLTLNLGNYVLGKFSPIHSLEFNSFKRMQVCYSHLPVNVLVSIVSRSTISCQPCYCTLPRCM